MRKIVMILSDIHGGSRYGLLKPGTEIFDESPDGQLVPFVPELTESQKYLREIFVRGIDEVVKFADGDEILGILNGDMCQGNKHPALLVTTRMADQIKIAAEIISELVTVTSHLRIGTSTEAHAFGANSADILVGESLQLKFPLADISVVRHGLINWGGLDVDFSHHGPFPGSRKWLKGNVARYYLQSLMLDEIAHDRKPPDLVCRAHFHEYVEEVVTIGQHVSRIVLTPSFCMLDDYGLKVARSPSRITNGMIAYEIIDGMIGRTLKVMETIDVRRRETIE